MCGIIGYVSEEGKDIERGLEAIAHRGPDASGMFTKLDFGKNIVLGHRRLSIIDLDESSNQPFYSDCGRYVLVFNGEIYNFQSLKSQLVAKGVNFKSKGDTEVLLNWLIQYGLEKLNELDGMFAFCFYDTQINKMYLVRDQLGIKPIYYSNEYSEFCFSSEIKGLFALNKKLRNIDDSKIAEYLLSGFLYEPDTGFKGVYKVRPGHYLDISIEDLSIKEVEYFDVTSTTEKAPNVASLIKNNIHSQKKADVQLGLFFSGGIDSSIILSETYKEISSITVKSDEERYNKSGVTSDNYYAKQIANKFNIFLEEVDLEDSINSNEDFLRAVEEVANWNEELMLDFTFISSYNLSKAAREKGFLVMLSGMGADELFGGYNRYQLLVNKRVYKVVLPFLNLGISNHPWLAKKIDRFKSFYEEKDFLFSYSSLVGYLSKNQVYDLLVKGNDGLEVFREKMAVLLDRVKRYSPLKKALYMDYFGFLSHNFSVADKSSMRASIEMRVPLATHGLFRSTWSMKDNELVDSFHRKKPLREFLLVLLPKKWVDRKKAGFNPPLDGYIMNLGREEYLKSLSSTPIYKFLDKKQIRSFVEAHYSLRKNNTYILYQFLHLGFWLKING